MNLEELLFSLFSLYVALAPPCPEKALLKRIGYVCTMCTTPLYTPAQSGVFFCSGEVGEVSVSLGIHSHIPSLRAFAHKKTEWRSCCVYVWLCCGAVMNL